MRAVRAALFVSLFAGAACGPPKASTNLDALGHELFRVWPERPMPTDGLSALVQALTPRSLTGDLGGRSWELTGPSPTDLTDITWPMDRDPTICIGSAVAWKSQWPVEDFARLQTTVDQKAFETSASAYLRSFVNPQDPSCIVDRSCLELDTSNMISRSNALYSMTYQMWKNFQWVQVDGQWALVGRAWTDRPWPFDANKGSLNQSYTVDLFLGRPDGTTWRYQATWSDTDLPVVTSGDLQRAIVTGAIDGMMQASDTYIGKTYHGM